MGLSVPCPKGGLHLVDLIHRVHVIHFILPSWGHCIATRTGLSNALLLSGQSSFIEVHQDFMKPNRPEGNGIYGAAP